DVVAGVRQVVRAEALQAYLDVRDGRLVVLVRGEARVELVAGGREIRDADDLLSGGPGRRVVVLVLAPVDGGAVALGQQLVAQQPTAGVGRPVGGRAVELVVHRRAGRAEPGEAHLTDEPLAERATFGLLVGVVAGRVGTHVLLDRAVAPALVEVGVRDG